MKPDISFNCYKKDGKLIIRNKSLFDAEVENLIEGKEYTLTLKRKYKQRSSKQNSYWWAVVVPIVFHGLRELGFSEIKTKEDAHEILKMQFLKTRIVNEQGQFIETFKSTTELSTSEFMDLLAEVQQWGAEFLGVDIPESNEKIEIDFQ